MIKTVLILMLVAAAAAAGNRFASALKTRADNLRLVGYMLNEIEILIEYKSATVYEIISFLSKDGRFDGLEFIKAAEKLCRSRDIPFGEAWKSAVAENTPACFGRSDAELICSVGKELGTSNTDGQLSVLRLKKHEVSRLAEEAECSYASKGKLYRSLGVLSGAFLAILLI